jgi:hypothetical protein
MTRLPERGKQIILNPRFPSTLVNHQGRASRRVPAALGDRRVRGIFIVRDRQALAYVYFEDEPGRRSAAKLLTKDEARPIAANIALPLRTATTPRGAVDRGRASASCRRGRSLETVAPRMLRWSSFRMRQQEMMQDMK